MGNSTSRVVECFVPPGHTHGKGDVDLDFLEPLDEGLGHSFCYVRPGILDSPALTPSNSDRFTLDSSTLDSETLSGSFRQEIVQELSGLQRPNKSFPETTFKAISGASVSANVSTARTGNQSAFLSSDTQEPAASFESTSSFASIPLQPLPRGSGPLNGFMSGPLERGYSSGPLDRGAGFMSGPMEKGGFMSGPLDSTDKSNFSAPLAYSRRRPGLTHLMRSVSGPVKGAFTRNFSKQSIGSGWMQRFFFHPVIQFVWHAKEPKLPQEPTQNSLEAGPSEGEYKNACNLQWAHGKAGEDRVHVVLSEEQGWLYVGIYDGFSGPDAPDFLMSNLYRAIDKELEGLFWVYEDGAMNDTSEPELPEDKHGDSDNKENVLPDSHHCSRVPSGGLEEPLDFGTRTTQASDPEIMEINDEARGMVELQEDGIIDESQSTNTSNFDTEAYCAPTAKLAGQGKKSKRLYELLEMERCSVQDTTSVEVGNRRMGLSDMQANSNGFCSRELLPDAELNSYLENSTGASSSCDIDDCNTVRGDGGALGMESEKGTAASCNISGRHQSTGRFLLGSKIRKMYRKQKSLRKKLFPWNYDWHREVTRADEKIVEPLGPTRKFKSGAVDHDAVLRAMARALEITEEAYLEMVEKMIDINPELALMGSCVLVMLMKDQDVYVLNLGDSRVILAQERQNDRHLAPKVLMDDARHQNRSRESLVRMELDRISEESPMHSQSQINKINKNREISIWRLKMRAIQLSMDHSTDVEEEVTRIKMEHADDDQAILNNRVKGQLKVTRAFGAEFLKKPRYNEALLEMFQIDYVGTSAYISSIPFVIHHRLSSTDRFLVLSSDGLYQYFSNEEVVCHVAWFIENVPEGDPAQYLIAELLLRAAKKNGMDFHELLDIPQGDRRKYHDDVSVMVVSLEGRIWRSSG